MKHAFAVLVPVCIVSLIGFFISLALFGTDTSEVKDYINVGIEKPEMVSSSWDVTEPYDKIDLNVAAAMVELRSSQGDKTLFDLTSDGSLDVDCKVSGSTLCIDVKSTGFGQFFSRLGEAIRNGKGWGDVFDNGNLVVYIPDRVYEKLEADLGSGTLIITDVSAAKQDIDIGSGYFRYDGADRTCDELDVDQGSGKCEIALLSCKKYDIDIGSGTYDIRGLGGSGKFNMGSGSGTIAFADVTGKNHVDVGSGTLSVYIPENADAVIKADIGSGKVNLNACGKNTSMQDDKNITLGAGTGELNIDLGSGRVDIADIAVISEMAEVSTDTVAVATTVLASENEAENVEPIQA